MVARRRGRRGSRSAPGRRRRSTTWREDLELQRAARCRGRPPRAASPRPASNRQPHSSAAPSSGRFERPSCGAPAMTSTSAGPSGVPRVGDREEQSQRRAAAAHQVGQAREDEAGGHEQRHGGRRQQHEHRHEHELRREDVAGADRELDPRDQRVERDEHDGGRRRRSPTSAPGTSRSATAPSTNSSAGHELGQELAAVDTARPRLPGLLEESLGGVVAADVVACGHPRP